MALYEYSRLVYPESTDVYKMPEGYKYFCYVVELGYHTVTEEIVYQAYWIDRSRTAKNYKAERTRLSRRIEGKENFVRWCTNADFGLEDDA